MSFATPEEARRHRNIYLGVFVALAGLTIVTVAISTLHLSIAAAVVLALLVAAAKGTLVACYFMHLISEKRIIYWVLALCAVFFVAVLLLPVFTEVDNATL